MPKALINYTLEASLLKQRAARILLQMTGAAEEADDGRCVCRFHVRRESRRGGRQYWWSSDREWFATGNIPVSAELRNAGFVKPAYIGRTCWP